MKKTFILLVSSLLIGGCFLACTQESELEPKVGQDLPDTRSAGESELYTAIDNYMRNYLDRNDMYQFFPKINYEECMHRILAVAFQSQCTANPIADGNNHQLDAFGKASVYAPIYAAWVWGSELYNAGQPQTRATAETVVELPDSETVASALASLDYDRDDYVVYGDVAFQVMRSIHTLAPQAMMQWPDDMKLLYTKTFVGAATGRLLDSYEGTNEIAESMMLYDQYMSRTLPDPTKGPYKGFYSVWDCGMLYTGPYMGSRINRIISSCLPAMARVQNLGRNYIIARGLVDIFIEYQERYSMFAEMEFTNIVRALTASANLADYWGVRLAEFYPTMRVLQYDIASNTVAAQGEAFKIHVKPNSPLPWEITDNYMHGHNDISGGEGPEVVTFTFPPNTSGRPITYTICIYYEADKYSSTGWEYIYLTQPSL